MKSSISWDITPSKKPARKQAHLLLARGVSNTLVVKKELQYLPLARLVCAKESALAVLLFEIAQFLR
jgi:hypothetical protein